MSDPSLKPVVEAVLLAAGGPLTLDNILDLFTEEQRPAKKKLREVLETLTGDYEGRGYELVEVGGGYRISVRPEYAPVVSQLWEERPPRYSRAMLETLALIAYRQPITRGEIEDIRGVSVSTNIVKTMLEREWIRVIGHRDVPGKPSLYATTREFLNYFGLKSLEELPTLQEIRDLDSINRELELGIPGMEVPVTGEASLPSDTAAGDENTLARATEGEAFSEVPQPEAVEEIAPDEQLPAPENGEPETGKPDG